MKLSISTLGCPEWSFGKIISEFKKLGINGIELRGVNGVMNFCDIPELSDERRDETLGILEENGLEFVCFGSSASFHDRGKLEKNIAEAKLTVDFAKKFGVPFVRVFGNNVSADMPDQSMKNIIEGVSEVCRYAEDSGVTVCLEIHGDINTAERLALVTESLKGYSSFGIIWDVCHTFSSCGNDIDEVYRVIRPFVKHVHLKDAVKAEGGTEIRTLGEGNINIEGIIQMLLSDGYSGYFSFEHEKVWHKELPEPEIEFPHFVEYMKNIKAV